MPIPCPFCEKVMEVGNGCTVEEYDDMEGGPYQRITYSNETRCGDDFKDTRVFCHDCNVTPGQFHHPGCDMEECPKCHGQAVSCGCCR